MFVLFDVVVLLCSMFYYTLEAVFRLVVSPAPMRIRGKVAVVTGGATGIGRAIAAALAEKGVKIAILDIDEAACAEAEAYIRDLAGLCFAYKCDVTKVKEVSAVASKIQEDLGDVDILVNNAGILIANDVLHLEEDVIRRTIDLNLVSQFWTVKEFVPSMLRRNTGHIVIISSMSAKQTRHLSTPYATSKWGLDGYGEALYDDLRALGGTDVNITTVYPRPVNTNMSKNLATAVNLDTSQLLSPEQVAEATVNGIVYNRRYVFVPPSAALVPFLDLLPYKARLAIKVFAGHAVADKGKKLPRIHPIVYKEDL